MTSIYPANQIFNGSLVLLQVLQTRFRVLSILLVKAGITFGDLSLVLPELQGSVRRRESSSIQPTHLVNQIIMALCQSIGHDSRVTEELLDSRSNLFLVPIDQTHSDQIVEDH